MKSLGERNRESIMNLMLWGLTKMIGEEEVKVEDRTTRTIDPRAKTILWKVLNVIIVERKDT